MHASLTPACQVLYLHGNHITNLQEVIKLAAGLPNLVKLTLHGTPVSEHGHYKHWVCAHLPQLRNLDFSSITRLQRDDVSKWSKYSLCKSLCITHAKRVLVARQWEVAL